MGLPAFLLSCGYYFKACLVVSGTDFRSVWPIQAYFHLAVSVGMCSYPVLLKTSLLLIFSVTWLAPFHMLSQIASTSMLFWCISFATWVALPAPCQMQSFHVLIIVLPFIIRRDVNLPACRGVSPDGIIQLSKEASSRVRLALVNIVSISVIVQSTWWVISPVSFTRVPVSQHISG